MATSHTKTFGFLTLDVFTDRAFAGNPLAVFPDATGLPEEHLQRIAREFNFSETVFVLPPENPAHTRRLRIFNPTSEMRFAGHPTVGTAIALVETGAVKVAGSETEIIFEEGAGPVPVRIAKAGSAPVQAHLTAPQVPAVAAEPPSVADIAAVLSLESSDFAATPACVSSGTPFVLAPLASVAAVSRADANLGEFRNVFSGYASEKVFLFAHDPATGAIRARMFAPISGIVEDPATGSAAACLAGYLAWQTPGDGIHTWQIDQGVEMGRPSVLHISATKQGGEVARVTVGGGAVVVTEGNLRLPE